MVDRVRLIAVLDQLLENADKYSPEAVPVLVTLESGPDGPLVSVLDRGPGIPEPDRERVFGRFYQVEDALHHTKPGMGLGLYIARRIVDAHGGRIWCEPRAGGGSAFRFSIPK
jgi:two-component system sensor histidine kinase KdpD